MGEEPTRDPTIGGILGSSTQTVTIISSVGLIERDGTSRKARPCGLKMATYVFQQCCFCHDLTFFGRPTFKLSILLDQNISTGSLLIWSGGQTASVRWPELSGGDQREEQESASITEGAEDSTSSIVG